MDVTDDTRRPGPAAKPAGRVMAVERVELHVAAELGIFTRPWDDLVADMPLPSPFLRSWWLEAATQGTPRFVLALADGELVGGLALQEDRRFGIRRLRFAGAGPLSPDQLDVAVRPGWEEPVTREVLRWLRSCRCLVQLDGIAQNALLFSIPGPVTRESRVVEQASYAKLGDWDQLLASKPAQVRQTIGKRRRRAERAGFRYRDLNAEELHRGLSALRELHARRWGQRSTFLPAWASFAAAAQKGVECGELSLHELVDDDGGPAAVCAMLRLSGRWSQYQTGMARRDSKYSGSGSVLLSYVVEDACRAGAHELDFLRGLEHYKQIWVTGTRTLSAVELAQSPAARFGLAAKRRLEATVRPGGRPGAPA